MAPTSRRTLAAIAAAFPLLVEGVLTSVWWGRLPDQMATTFGPDGSPTGYGTPLGTLILCGALQALFLVASIGSARARDRDKGRIACAVTAAFVAGLAISWLVLAGVASSALHPAAWWFIAAAPAWACVPYWLLSPAREHVDA